MNNYEKIRTEILSYEEKRKLISAVLQNDENATDEDLTYYFMEELNLSPEEAKFYLKQRNEALNNIDFNLIDYKEVKNGNNKPE